MRCPFSLSKLVLPLLAGLLFLAGSARAGLSMPPSAAAGLEALYAGDPEAAIAEFRALQQAQPDHPLGYLLEDEARWWRLYCSFSEFKYGMTDAWHRAKSAPTLAEDRAYLDLAQKVVTLAEARLRQGDSAEMQFYSGIGEALAARLYGLRWEKGPAARAGVRARGHLLRALALDPSLADADLGLGLYNYYVDTLSAMAKVLRFFMGIPGGSKSEGLRQLERAMTQGTLGSAEARFYLAKNLRNYDRDYERALAVLAPLTAQYPGNPLFALLRGDLNAKLARKEEAAAWYRKAAALPLRDAECRRHIQDLAQASLAALGPGSSLSATPAEASHLPANH
jgi:hypothetical protein